MIVTEFLDYNSIQLDGIAVSKRQALDEAIELMAESGNVSDKQEYKRAVYDRELKGSTGIGKEIAIPHGKSTAILRPGLSVLVLKDGVDFESLDGKSVKVVIMAALPEKSDNEYYEALQRLVRLSLHEDFVKDLMDAHTKKEFLGMIDRKEERLIEEEKKEWNVAKQYHIVGVTNSKLGLIYNFMVVEMLKKASKEMGCFIKIEIHGVDIVMNTLTITDIQEADFVIFMVDNVISVERFSGKKYIECDVSDGMINADLLIERAKMGDGKIVSIKQNKVPVEMVYRNVKKIKINHIFFVAIFIVVIFFIMYTLKFL